MTSESQLAEQHIREFQSRLKHLDELFERAQKGLEGVEHEEARAELGELERERDKLATHYEAIRLENLDNWQEEEVEKGGPMGLWDIVAQKLERLVERIERH